MDEVTRFRFRERWTVIGRRADPADVGQRMAAWLLDAVAVFGPDYGDGPCYRCLYQDDDESLDDCQGSGVVGPLPSIVGAMMALEAIKQITGVGRPLPFSVFDGRRGEWRQLALARRPDCDACGDINP